MPWKLEVGAFQMKVIKGEKIKIGFALLVVGIFLISCAKVKTPLENPAHPQDWTDVESTEFHANKVVLIGDVTCKSCHGSDLGAKESFCNQCHAQQSRAISYPHSADWMRFGRNDNHGEFVKAHSGELTCNRCHGGVNDQAPACSDCHLEGVSQ